LDLLVNQESVRQNSNADKEHLLVYVLKGNTKHKYATYFISSKIANRKSPVSTW